jgi:hypothetical protein
MHPMGRAGAINDGLLTAERSSASPISSVLKSVRRRRAKSRARGGGGGAMPDQGDAMTKAWTYAVLDALEAADETTRLEIARILCPAGFVIVPTELMELPKRQKN